MELDLFINNIKIDTLDPPEGLDGINISYNRTKYQGLSTEIDIKLVFYCASGKEAIDAEFERAFVNGNGYVIFRDECGGTEIETKFILDFRTYEADDNSTKLGLKEDNDVNRWDDKEDTLIELTDEEDVLVRNTINGYSYLANEGVIEQSEVDETFTGSNNPTNRIMFSPFMDYKTIINELEDGNDLSSNFFHHKMLENLPSLVPTRLFENAVEVLPTPTNSRDYVDIEPFPIFENVLEMGSMTIKISGDRSTNIECTEINARTPGLIQGTLVPSAWRTSSADEWIFVGRRFDRPRLAFRNNLYSGSPSNVFLAGSLTPYTSCRIGTDYDAPNADWEIGFTVEKNESVWYWRNHYIYPQTTSSFVKVNFLVGDLKMFSNEQIEAKFETTNLATENILTPLNVFFNSYHTKAIKASSIATQLFENLNPIALETHFDDLYLTNGEMIRNRTNRQSFKMKPKDFYENLNKLIPIGIGMNYSGTPELQMLTYEELYENTVFKTFNDVDFISEVKVSIAENMLYNEVEVGYKEFKESNEELHRKNSYVINGGRGNGKLNLVTDWLASKYLFKKAKNESAEQEGKEYDNKIFILSIEDAYGFKITKSQNNNPTAPLFDNVLEFNGGNVLGLNRRYSTVINLINQKFRWGLAFWKSINGLSPTNETVYTKDLEYADTYHDYLDGFPISANNTFDATLTHVAQVVPKYIEFSVVMSIVEFYDIRKNWYKAIEIVGNKTYKGNIIEARYQNGVCNFKLLNRI
jgi:predicted DNA-binding antitoxin AbrB/MazE fold protein